MLATASAVNRGHGKQRNLRRAVWWVLLCGPFILLILLVLTAWVVRRLAHNEIMRLRTEIAVGDDVGTALAKCRSSGVLSCHERGRDIWAKAVLPFPTYNLVLWIDSDGAQVTALRVRTDDSLDSRPPGGPADIGVRPTTPEARR